MELEDKLIDGLERLVTEHTEGLVKGLSFLGLFLINHKYFDTREALGQTALSYLLLTSGTEIGIVTAIGGIALREWSSDLKLKEGKLAEQILGEINTP